MASVFLNGSFVERDHALVSAFDAGLQHGVGLFETMVARRPERGGDARARVTHLREHVDRLIVSARALGLSESLRGGAIEEAVVRTCERAFEELAGVERVRVRLTVTGGDLNLLEMGKGWRGEREASSPPDPRSQRGGGEDKPTPNPLPRGGGLQEPTLLIAATPATAYPREMFERGVAVVIGELKLNPLDPHAGHKTLNYWGRLRELQIAAGKGAGEALLFQVTNFLGGGCVSNAFIVKDDVLITPIARGEEEDVARGEEELEEEEETPTANPGFGAPTPQPPPSGRGIAMPSPVLPGVTRRWVMDVARREGWDVERRMVRIDEVLGADEVFLANSSWGVLPVVKVEREAIGDGVVGPVAKKLVEEWAGV